MASVTCRAEYHSDIYVVRLNGAIIDTLPDAARAASLANRLAGALETTVNA